MSQWYYFFLFSFFKWTLKWHKPPIRSSRFFPFFKGTQILFFLSFFCFGMVVGHVMCQLNRLSCYNPLTKTLAISALINVCYSCLLFISRCNMTTWPHVHLVTREESPHFVQSLRPPKLRESKISGGGCLLAKLHRWGVRRKALLQMPWVGK